MAREQLDRVIEALANVHDDSDARHHLLERASLSLLRQPPLGGQLVARLCAAEEDDSELEDLSDLLGYTLEAARLARESGKKRGDAFLSSIEEAIELAARRGGFDPTRRLLLARLWTQSGLTAPGALKLTAEDIAAPQPIELPDDPTTSEAILDGLFDDLVRQTEGDALSIHAALAEIFATIPEPMREQVVKFALIRPEPVYDQLGYFWLLDPLLAIRIAAARGLASRLANGLMTAETSARLVMLRSWMPEDEARKRVDQILRHALRLGASPAVTTARWTIQSVLTTLPDGAGAQSFTIALRSGKKRRTAMVLLKQGRGVKDAYVAPCESAGDQKSLMKHVVKETAAQTVPIGYFAEAVSTALGDGLAQDIPPAPGLADVAALCGLTDLRPTRTDTESLLASLAAHARVIALSAQRRRRLIGQSKDWWDRHQIVQSWLEESDDAYDILNQQQSPRGLESALWKWLATRRDWWAHLIARAAAMLEAAGHRDADSFTATAMALLEGYDLKKIPVMADIHDRTIASWILEDPDTDSGTNLEDLVAIPNFADLPKPERRGELARLLKGSSISAEWIEGFMMAVLTAPKAIAPDRWLPIILDGAITNLGPSSLQRFIDIVMMRTTDAIALARDSRSFERRMGKLAGPATQDWATGFTIACNNFRTSWPGRSMGPDDRAMLRVVSGAVESGLDESELRKVGQWIAARHERNQSSS